MNSKIGNNINFLNKVFSLLNTLFICLLYGFMPESQGQKCEMWFF